MFAGRCSQCGGRVERDMDGGLHCRGCGSYVPAGPIIPMPPPNKKDKDIWPKDRISDIKPWISNINGPFDEDIEVRFDVVEKDSLNKMSCC